ncbi:bifunctional NOG1 [Babesia duncani]|uniref:Nucleolar GTP-binding protein 1 n=1 Tax=Babesia duncani TaxID=323732 RepID=A0AAD9UQH3_9APIC|nr:bifunctional NOG1 [Babesia duncani]
MTSKQLTYNFKAITTVPTATKLVDIVLSQTQKKTPTEVHKQFKISRIRKFYMRKIKYCQQICHDRLQRILSQFPHLDDIHPFYADLCNVLYDRDHYKLALGQCNAIKGVVDRIAKEYVRQMKFATSLYRCKMLKKAALGRMCTALKKLKGSLKYLEDVRQHMSRLPSINPYTRTLILTGYPNVGKSSFMNQVSKANVDVQPYSFTTRSLYVGHFDHDFLRWQVIDTPGLLDHPLDQRNTIEMTAITALAHIYCAVLFFLDISETCGYSLEQQIALFQSIKPLFHDRPTLVVLNKIDLGSFSLERLQPLSNFKCVHVSALTGQGVDDAKEAACRLLLDQRLSKKISDANPEALLKVAYVTKVQPSDKRPHVPKPHVDPNVKIVTEKQQEERAGGSGVYSIDHKKKFILANNEWRYDEVPDFFQGENVIDFAYPGNEQALKMLEKEEELLLSKLQYDADDKEWEDLVKRESNLHARIRQRKLERQLKKTKGGPILHETVRLGKIRKRGASRIKLAALAKIQESDPSNSLKTKLQIAKTRALEHRNDASYAKQKPRVKFPRGVQAENDRTIPTKRPKHMLSGKRTLGKTSRR